MSDDVFVSLGPPEPERDRELAAGLGIDPVAITTPAKLATPAGILGRLRRRPTGRLVFPIRRPERAATFVPLALWILAARPRSVLTPTGDGRWTTRSLPRFLLDSVTAVAIQILGAPLTLAGHVAALSLLGRRMTARPIGSGVRRVAYLRVVPGYTSRVGGAMTHAEGVIRGLRAIGGEVTINEALVNAPRARRSAGHFQVPLPFRLLPGFLSMGGDLVLLAKARSAARSADLIYQRLTPCSTAALMLSAVSGKPFAIEYNSTIDHDGTQVLLGRYERFVERLNLRYASRILVISSALERSLVERGIDPARIVLNPNGVDPGRFTGERDTAREALGIEEGHLAYGFIGSFGFWHGAPVLAAAFADFAEERPEARLLLVGDGAELSETLGILEDAGLGDRTIVTGQVDADSIPGLLEACDILCSPHVPWPGGKEFHGSPTKLFEYMAAGRAILASDLGQIGEVLDHEETALLLPPGDATALADAMARLHDDPELRRRLGSAAAARARERHTWERNARRIIAADPAGA